MKQKPAKIKTFKCEECRDVIPCLKFDSQYKKLVDAKKYISCKIVCGRCYDRIREENRLNRLKTTKKHPLWMRLIKKKCSIKS